MNDSALEPRDCLSWTWLTIRHYALPSVMTTVLFLERYHMPSALSSTRRPLWPVGIKCACQPSDTVATRPVLQSSFARAGNA